MPTIEDQAVAKKLWEDAKGAAIGVAKLRGHGLDQKEYTPEEELMMWNRVAPGWTPEKELALLAEGKTPAQVGYLKYPERQKMIEQGERVLDRRAQFKYAADMAKKADPTWSVTPPAGSQEPTPAAPALPSTPISELGG